MHVGFDKWEVILRHNVRRGIILGQKFESGFRRRISKKKNHDCVLLDDENIFFFENKS